MTRSLCRVIIQGVILCALKSRTPPQRVVYPRDGILNLIQRSRYVVLDGQTTLIWSFLRATRAFIRQLNQTEFPAPHCEAPFLCVDATVYLYAAPCDKILQEECLSFSCFIWKFRTWHKLKALKMSVQRGTRSGNTNLLH